MTGHVTICVMQISPCSETWLCVRWAPLDREIHRLRSVPLQPKTDKSLLRMPGKAVTDQVFARDGWRCRFCGVRLVVPPARKALAIAVPDALCWQGPNAALHAAFLYVSATLDHVVPHARGGTNDMDNLVAACWPCNFGRGGYLLEQMGLIDPRQRLPNRDKWDGLIRILRQPSQRQPAQAEVCTIRYGAVAAEAADIGSRVVGPVGRHQCRAARPDARLPRKL